MYSGRISVYIICLANAIARVLKTESWEPYSRDGSNIAVTTGILDTSTSKTYLGSFSFPSVT
jgi:hypothetical protein